MKINVADLRQAIYKSSETNNGITIIEGKNKSVYISYKKLLNTAIFIKEKLEEQGVVEGKELVFQLDNIENFISIFWACVVSGVIAIPIIPARNYDQKLKLKNVIDILSDPIIIFDDVLKDNLNDSLEFVGRTNLKKLYASQILSDIDNLGYCSPFSKEAFNQICFVQFSSGSTGLPKGVTLTHHSLLVNIQDMADGINLKSHDITLSWMPLTHDMGIIGGHILPTVMGINQYLMSPTLFAKNPSLFLNCVSDNKITITMSPNFGYTHILKYLRRKPIEQLDMSSIRVILNGAEPVIYDDCIAFLSEMKPYGLRENTIMPVYGMAEACLGISFSIPNEKIKYLTLDRRQLCLGHEIPVVNSENSVKFVSTGIPLKNCNVKIYFKGKEVKEKVIGTIFICGENVTSGYYNDVNSTNELIQEGWLDTGDLGFMYNGEVYITGREKELIIINGRNYYPHDLEKLLKDEMAVHNINCKEVVSTALANPDNSEILAIFIVEGKTNMDIVSPFIREIVFKKVGLTIEFIVTIKNVPRTTSRKIQRHKLQELYDKGQLETDKVQTGSRTKNQTYIVKILVDICNNILDQPIKSADDNFYDMGVSSLLIASILEQIENKLNISLEIADIYSYPTINKLADYISNVIDRNDSLVSKVVNEGLFKKLDLMAQTLMVEKASIVFSTYILFCMSKSDHKYENFRFYSNGLLLLNTVIESNVRTVFDIIKLFNERLIESSEMPSNNAVIYSEDYFDYSDYYMLIFNDGIHCYIKAHRCDISEKELMQYIYFVKNMLITMEV